MVIDGWGWRDWGSGVGAGAIQFFKIGKLNNTGNAKSTFYRVPTKANNVTLYIIVLLSVQGGD